MSTITAEPPDVFSAREIARAAGISPREVTARIRSGALATVDGRFVARREAVRAVRELRTAVGRHDLFSPPPVAERSPARALLASGALHGLVLGALAIIATLGVPASATPQQALKPARMVFLATPGPGGGGGGGGLKQPAPARPAELRGTSPLRSPVPPVRPRTPRVEPRPIRTPPTPPVRPRPAEKPAEPPAVAAPPQPLPQVTAPVATAAADPRDQAGVLAEPAADTSSQGPGTGTGAGTGQGTGMGEGDGSGIGPGSGGGTGGGPYRAGSGISPPEILREVKPDYTEDARRRGVEGDVVLEIVVRRDGRVGTIRLLQGLGAGLDQRAIDAVRQWRFAPAMRQGTPVDVMVEVAVEFTLR